MSTDILYGEPGGTNFLKDYLKSATPLVFANVINSLHSLMAVLLASSISVNAVSAIGFINRIYFVYGALVIALGAAASIKMNKMQPGKGLFFQIRPVFVSSMIFSLLCSLICFFVFFILADVIAELADPEDKVVGMTSYLRWIAVSYMLSTMVNPLYTLLISRKKGHLIFKSALFSVSAGLVFSCVSIYIFREGIHSLGEGLFLTESVFAICIAYFYLKEISIRQRKYIFMFRHSELKENLLSMGTDVKNVFISLVIVHCVDLTIFALFSGDPGVGSVMSYYFSTNGMVQSICLGFATAASVEVARSLKGSVVRYEFVNRQIMRLGLTIPGVMAALAYIYLTVGMRQFLQADLPENINYALGVIILVNAIGAFLQRSILRSNGDTGFMKRISLISSLGGRLPYAAMLCFLLPLSPDRVFFLYFGFACLSLVVCFFVWRRANYLIAINTPIGAI
ncbi:hypothetical protein TX23_21555 [Pseudomonas paralactis]|uniref:Uncharacterized protein n=1 Tax=Pseudomonas paralactis TaxID=1615673 RepID=A0A0R3AG00_9PSED|nr:MATE family efflux transporter [Pseudomonas paralactis]KRP69956.1 hypothetical protein TX23_21555 [Pseudomonas paralactis]